MNITPDRARRTLTVPPRIAPIPAPAWLQPLPETLEAKKQRREAIRLAKAYEDATAPPETQTFRVNLVLADLTVVPKFARAGTVGDIAYHYLGGRCSSGSGARVVRVEITGEEGF